MKCDYRGVVRVVLSCGQELLIEFCLENRKEFVVVDECQKWCESPPIAGPCE